MIPFLQNHAHTEFPHGCGWVIAYAIQSAFYTDKAQQIGSNHFNAKIVPEKNDIPVSTVAQFRYSGMWKVAFPDKSLFRNASTFMLHHDYNVRRCILI